MNLVKVKDTFFKECKSQGADPYNQLLHNEAGRPCVLVVKLKYKGVKRNFVVPLKSNITANTDKTTYFAFGGLSCGPKRADMSKVTVDNEHSINIAVFKPFNDLCRRSIIINQIFMSKAF